MCESGVFVGVSTDLSTHELFLWGWRVPLLASAVLILVGLYVRLQLVETPAFRRSLEQGERVPVPLLTVIAQHPRALLLGILATTTTFLVFYFMTAFALSWATPAFRVPRSHHFSLHSADDPF